MEALYYTQTRATQADDHEIIGTKSIFTPAFQRRLFTHFTPQEIFKIESLLKLRVLRLDAATRQVENQSSTGGDHHG